MIESESNGKRYGEHKGRATVGGNIAVPFEAADVLIAVDFLSLSDFMSLFYVAVDYVRSCAVLTCTTFYGSLYEQLRSYSEFLVLLSKMA